MNENYLDWQYISSLDGNVDLPYALQIFADLHIHHMNNCAEYRHIITSLFRDLRKISDAWLTSLFTRLFI